MEDEKTPIEEVNIKTPEAATSAGENPGLEAEQTKDEQTKSTGTKRAARKKAKVEKEDDEFLVPRQKYLASGIHIGMKQRTKQMKGFIYKIRPDGLAVMNLQLIDERVRIAAKFLAKANSIVVVSRRNVAHKTIEKFVEVVGGMAITGRFMPGTLTNPNYEGFQEADIVVIADPMSDYQAIKEAVNARIPIVAICDTFNETNNIDLVIPANNKGIKSLATLFWLLGREILKERGDIKSDEEYKYKPGDFAKEMEYKKEQSEGESRERGRYQRGQRGRRAGRARVSRKR